MELELKHIMPYIPYGVLGYFQDEDDGTNYYATKIDISCIEWLMSDGTIVLRPLSDLTKEIEVNGEKFVAIVELLKIKYRSYLDEYKDKKYSEIGLKNHNNFAQAFVRYNANLTVDVWYNSLKETPYWIMEKLFEWHFDVFGLIEAGLAIDINTLNQK